MSPGNSFNQRMSSLVGPGARSCKRLVAAAIAYSASALAKRPLLGVYARNHSAIAFYERAGLGKLGDRKFNVGGRDYDDDIMGLRLDA